MHNNVTQLTFPGFGLPLEVPVDAIKTKRPTPMAAARAKCASSSPDTSVCMECHEAFTLEQENMQHKNRKLKTFTVNNKTEKPKTVNMKTVKTD